MDVELFIQDVDPLTASVENVEAYCPGDEVELTVNVSGGLPAYSYLWETGDVTPTITVSPGVSTTYNVTVNDACLGIPLTVSGDVIVPEYPPLNVSTTPDTSVLCPNTPLVLTAEPFGGEGVYFYEWIVDGVLIVSSSFVNVSPMETTTYVLSVTDGC